MKSREILDGAKSYLLSRFENGLCLEFFQLKHGPSLAWTTACIGSTLTEFQVIPQGTLKALLSLQWKGGGWSYNQKSLPDADSTLRVLQFLNKVGFAGQAVIRRAEKFVIAHQQTDGGVATYLPETVAAMKYPVGGWTATHPCVTALAARVLQNQQARNKARRYITSRLDKGDARSYWWQTPWYVRYEAGVINTDSISSDPVEMSLALLLKVRLGMTDKELATRLIRLQHEDGSFPVSHQFRVPRPNQLLDNITEQVEVVEDSTRIFSTAAAVVAISRHEALIS